MSDTKRPLKVFLCHAHADHDPVRGLYTRLTQDGVDAWLDKENLLPGAAWEYEIRKAVRDADVVVVCLSKQFNQAGFRQKEVKLALETALEKPEGEIFIIPARLEECDTPESLSKWHWVNLFEGEGYKRLLNVLHLRADVIGAISQIRRNLEVTGICLIHGPYDGPTCPYPHGITTLASRDQDSENPIMDENERDPFDITELEAPISTTLGILWVKEGNKRGGIHFIKHGTIIGRKDGDLILDDPKVNRMHAKLTMEDDYFIVWDLGTSNGTYVNGKRIREATPLDENDLVKIGDTVFVVKLLTPHPKRKPVRKNPIPKRQ